MGGLAKVPTHKVGYGGPESAGAVQGTMTLRIGSKNLIQTWSPTSNTSTLQLSLTHSLSKWLYRSASLRHLFFSAFYFPPKKMIGETFCPTHVSSGQDRQVWYISV